MPMGFYLALYLAVISGGASDPSAPGVPLDRSVAMLNSNKQATTFQAIELRKTAHLHDKPLSLGEEKRNSRTKDEREQSMLVPNFESTPRHKLIDSRDRHSVREPNSGDNVTKARHKTNYLLQFANRRGGSKLSLTHLSNTYQKSALTNPIEPLGSRFLYKRETATTPSWQRSTLIATSSDGQTSPTTPTSQISSSMTSTTTVSSSSSSSRMINLSTSATAAATYATVNYDGLIGVNATDPYAITSEQRSFVLSIQTKILMCLLYGTLAFTAITSNMIICYIVLSNQRMRTATNFFIVNLAVGDILMASLCIPFTFAANIIFQYWPFGLSLCVIVSYSQANSVFISAYTMVAISIDKYLAIMYPMRLRMSKLQAKIIILIIWSAALTTSLPTAILSRLVSSNSDNGPPSTTDSFVQTSTLTPSSEKAILPTTTTPAATTVATRATFYGDSLLSDHPNQEQQESTQAAQSILSQKQLANASSSPLPTTGVPIGDFSEQRRNFCEEVWDFWPVGKYYYSMALMILQFVLPLFVLVITYTRIVIVVWVKRMPGEEDDARDARMARSKRKMIKMVILCVIAFALTWLPFNALIIIGDLQPSIWEHRHISYIWFVTHYLAMCHTITNPLIYIWMNNRFRAGFEQVIGSMCKATHRLLALIICYCLCFGCLLNCSRQKYRRIELNAKRKRQRQPLTSTGSANHNTAAAALAANGPPGGRGSGGGGAGSAAGASGRRGPQASTDSSRAATAAAALSPPPLASRGDNSVAEPTQLVAPQTSKPCEGAAAPQTSQTNEAAQTSKRRNKTPPSGSTPSQAADAASTAKLKQRRRKRQSHAICLQMTTTQLYCRPSETPTTATAATSRGQCDKCAAAANSRQVVVRQRGGQKCSGGSSSAAALLLPQRRRQKRNKEAAAAACRCKEETIRADATVRRTQLEKNWRAVAKCKAPTSGQFDAQLGQSSLSTGSCQTNNTSLTISPLNTANGVADKLAGGRMQPPGESMAAGALRAGGSAGNELCVLSQQFAGKQRETLAGHNVAADKPASGGRVKPSLSFSGRVQPFAADKLYSLAATCKRVTRSLGGSRQQVGGEVASKPNGAAADYDAVVAQDTREAATSDASRTDDDVGDVFQSSGANGGVATQARGRGAGSNNSLELLSDDDDVGAADRPPPPPNISRLGYDETDASSGSEDELVAEYGDEDDDWRRRRLATPKANGADRLELVRLHSIRRATNYDGKDNDEEDDGNDADCDYSPSKIKCHRPAPAVTLNRCAAVAVDGYKRHEKDYDGGEQSLGSREGARLAAGSRGRRSQSYVSLASCGGGGGGEGAQPTSTTLA